MSDLLSTEKKVYNIRKIEAYNGIIPWDQVYKVEITHYPWNTNGYKPKTEVGLCRTDQALHLYFRSFEREVKISYSDFNDPVYKDSCAEFFFNPSPGTQTKYFNVECNAMGIMLIGLGEHRDDNKLIEDCDWSQFEIRSSITTPIIGEHGAPFWELSYKIPFNFIQKYIPSFSPNATQKMTGNFYKCGDSFTFPHYGCWNPIENERPNFHLSAFFGELVFD